MTVCKATKCRKRELCMNYSENYFKYNPTSDWMQLIDWSAYGSAGYGQKEDGTHIINQTYSCGDDSIKYPLFEPIPVKDREKIVEALKYIEGQLEDGYIDLGLHDNDELELIEQAINEFKVNHGI